MNDLQALEALARYVPADADPALRRWLGARQMTLAAARWRPPSAAVTFTWRGGRSFEVNGEPVRSSGLGLLLGWFVLAAHQHRLQGLEPTAVYPRHGRPDAAALEAIQRAAMHVPEPLAGCLRAIGTAGGMLAVKGRLPCDLVCSSPELVQATT